MEGSKLLKKYKRKLIDSLTAEGIFSMVNILTPYLSIAEQNEILANNKTTSDRAYTLYGKLTDSCYEDFVRGLYEIKNSCVKYFDPDGVLKPPELTITSEQESSYAETSDTQCDSNRNSILSNDEKMKIWLKNLRLGRYGKLPRRDIHFALSSTENLKIIQKQYEFNLEDLDPSLLRYFQ